MWKWDLLCYSEKGQLHIDPCLCAGLHKRYTILLRWKDIRGVSGLSVVGITCEWGLYVTFASFSPSSVFTTLSAAMSDCKTPAGNENESSWGNRRRRGRRFTMPLATVMHHHVSLHILLSGSSPASWRARAPWDWWDVRKLHLQQQRSRRYHRLTPPGLLLSQRMIWAAAVWHLQPQRRVESSLSHQRELSDLLAMTAGCNETWKFLFSSTSGENGLCSCGLVLNVFCHNSGRWVTH